MKSLWHKLRNSKIVHETWQPVAHDVIAMQKAGKYEYIASPTIKCDNKDLVLVVYLDDTCIHILPYVPNSTDIQISGLVEVSGSSSALRFALERSLNSKSFITAEIAWNAKFRPVFQK